MQERLFFTGGEETAAQAAAPGGGGNGDGIQARNVRTLPEKQHGGGINHAFRFVNEGDRLPGQEAAPRAPVEPVDFRETGFQGDKGGEIAGACLADQRRTMSSRWMMAGRPL